LRSERRPPQDSSGKLETVIQRPARGDEGVERTQRMPPTGPAVDPASQFVRRHFAFVWRVLRRLGLSSADADDAAQRVMMAATKRLNEIRVGRERAFLYRTSTFIVARERRSRRRRAEEQAVDLDRERHPGADPEALLSERRALERLDSILNRMPSELRTAFVLFEIEGLSKEEVAEALEIPAGTAASRLRRAREDFARRAQRFALTDGRKGATG
jgi:RNA polymerase sigma-70 factor (ECF subfamily)